MTNPRIGLVSTRGATLSGDAKDALAREPPVTEHCRAALRDGLAYYGRAPGAADVFRTQRAPVARLAWALFDDRKGRPIRKIPGKRLFRTPSYEIDLTGYHPSATKPAARCDRRIELRAAFLACGSLSVPARGYHLEFVPPSESAAKRIATLLHSEGVKAKRGARAGRPLVYVKDVDAIATVLAAIGASGAVLALEDLRALKETKNRIHRLVNTEAANVDRATGAAAAQREAIVHVADAYGLRNLSRPLREAAELRLAHPEETLSELGRRCNPPVQKSTINGRIAALIRLSRALDAGKKGLGSERTVTD